MNAKRFLLVSADRQFVDDVSRRAEQMQLEFQTAHDLPTTLSALDKHTPDVFCIHFSSLTSSSQRLLESLVHDPLCRTIPLVVLKGADNVESAKLERTRDVWYVEDGANTLQDLEQFVKEIVGVPNPGEIDDAVNVATVTDKTDVITTVFEILGANPDWLDDTANDVRHTCDDQHWEGSPPWVLLIEDDCDLSLAVKLRLECRGVAVVRAFEGLQGVKEAFTQPAEAIILDFNLPNGQGDYVLRRLKASPVTKDIPVIVVTGVKDQALQHKMLSLGAAAFLTKPIEFEKLLGELNRHIDVLPGALRETVVSNCTR